MEIQGQCASDSELQHLLLGMVPSDEAARLEAHVLGCRICGERLAGIEAEDTLVAAAHGSTTVPNWGDDAKLEALVDRLCHLPMPAGTSGEQSASEILDELRRYLAPAESVGELGRIGDFRIVKVLGSGGMGIVLEAEDTQLGRRVALKVMKPHLAASASARTRFLREARAAAAIQHDNVVTIHQVGEHAGLPYLAMQLLDGEPLSRRLTRQGKLPPDEAIRVGRQIALGLAAAHARDVVHRDIKPDNIWLEREGDRVKILDFGLAHVADDLPRLTQSGAVAGTPAYMAPEQIANVSVDRRADLFSLGCVLYEMTTGRRAFAGSSAATLLAVTREKPSPPREIEPGLPQPLSDLTMKLIEKDRVRRCQTADDVLAALSENASSAQQASGGRNHGKMIAIGLATLFVTIVTAAVILIKTGEGTLVLEINQPDVTAMIDGEKVLLHSPRDEVDVRVGRHDLEIRKGGFHTFTQSFEVSRGGKVEVAARLEPSASPVAAKPVQPASLIVNMPKEPPPASLMLANPTPVKPTPAISTPVSSTPAYCMTAVADGNALIEWLGKSNSHGPESKLVRDVRSFMEKQNAVGEGFYYLIGPKLVKSGKLAIVCSHNGQFFVGELPPSLSKRGRLADNTALNFGGIKDVTPVAEPRAKLLAVTIDGAEDLEATKEITGFVRLQDLPRKERDFGLRMTVLDDETYDAFGTWDKFNGGTVPFRFSSHFGISQTGPVVVFVEICHYTDTQDREFEVVSNTIATVVNVRPK